MNIFKPKQKDNLYTAILKARKVKLQKEKILMDRLLLDRLQAQQLNQSRRFNRQNPGLNSLDHYSDSQYSVYGNEETVLITKKQFPDKFSPFKIQQNQLELTGDELLTQKAKRFIHRLRKQKQYNEGRLLLLRKREQQKRQLQMARQDLEKKSLQFRMKKSRINKLMDNILYHEQKISERAAAAYSLKRLKRSSVRAKTENSDRSNLSKSVNIEENDQETILTLKKRVKELSEMIDSFSS